MRVWRISQTRFASTLTDAFSGIGGLYAHGRWHHKGTQITYCTSSSALAVLEILVHVDPATAPSPLSLMYAEIPDSISTLQIKEHELPKNWRDIDPSPVALQKMGDSFINDGKAAVLIVPSVIAPNDTNVLLNPAHPDFSKITLHQEGSFEFDPRLGVKS